MPRLGIVDKGGSALVDMIGKNESITLKEYSTEDGLKQAVLAGKADAGIVLPENFDKSLLSGVRPEIGFYIWGASLAKNRLVISAAVVSNIRNVIGKESPVEIKTVTLGDEDNVPWSERIMPFIVLITIFFGGVFLPATSIISEKEKRTLTALTVTPASIHDVFIAKGVFGIVLSMVMGTIILLLNRSFGIKPGLLVMMLALGAIMAACIGLLFGAVVKDLNSFFAIFKAFQSVLFAPGIVYMFPKIPQWASMIFPTHYLIRPIIDITQKGKGWPEIATNVYILLAILTALIIAVMLVLSKVERENAA